MLDERERFQRAIASLSTLSDEDIDALIQKHGDAKLALLACVESAFDLVIKRKSAPDVDAAVEPPTKRHKPEILFDDDSDDELLSAIIAQGTSAPPQSFPVINVPPSIITSPIALSSAPTPAINLYEDDADDDDDLFDQVSKITPSSSFKPSGFFSAASTLSKPVQASSATGTSLSFVASTHSSSSTRPRDAPSADTNSVVLIQPDEIIDLIHIQQRYSVPFVRIPAKASDAVHQSLSQAFAPSSDPNSFQSLFFDLCQIVRSTLELFVIVIV